MPRLQLDNNVGCWRVLGSGNWIQCASPEMGEVCFCCVGVFVLLVSLTTFSKNSTDQRSGIVFSPPIPPLCVHSPHYRQLPQQTVFFTGPVTRRMIAAIGANDDPRDNFVVSEQQFGSVNNASLAQQNIKEFAREHLFRIIKWRFKNEDVEGINMFKNMCLQHLGWKQQAIYNNPKATDTWCQIKGAAAKAIQIRRGSAIKSIKEKMVEGM